MSSGDASPWNAVTIAQLRSLYAEGLTDPEISQIMDLPPRAVTGKRQRLGLMITRSDPYETAVRRARREQQASP